MRLLLAFLLYVYTSDVQAKAGYRQQLKKPKIVNSDDKYLIYGFEQSQPPPLNQIVTIVDHEVGLSAQQVCGYTDWSTVQIKLPKQLLSKEYWKNVGSTLKDSAIKAVTSLSGAIPGMLICNVSPTFCHIYNQAELMAAFEGQLTFDTCKMLDGIANTSSLQGESLKNCVRNLTSGQGVDGVKYDASTARERCLHTAGTDSFQKNGQVNQTSDVAGEKGRFKMLAFINKLFPKKVTGASGESHTFSSGAFVYSRQWESAKIMKALFPGVEVHGRLTVMKGGSFAPTVDSEVRKQAKEIQDFLIKILKVMRRLQIRGYAPGDIIIKSSYLWNDKAAWQRSKKIPVIYRSRADGGDPSFLIRPDQILELLPLVENSDFSETPEGDMQINRRLRNALAQLSISTARLQMNDHLQDIYLRTLNQCHLDPEYQGALAQKNCQLILKRTKSDLELMALKANAEKRAVQVQKNISTIVIQAKKEKAASYTPFSPRDRRNNKSLIPWPGSF